MATKERRRFEQREPVYDPETEARIAEFVATVEELRALPYDRYLKTPHWRRLRERVLERAGHRCEYCRARRPAFAVHHLTYARLGAELLTDLQAVCKGCHEWRHEKTRPAAIRRSKQRRRRRR